MQRTFDYGFARVRDLAIHTGAHERTGKTLVTGIEVGGELATPTRRFWTSFFARFGIADNVFKYFDHQEVFQRISERAANDVFRYCLDRNERGGSKLLAVTSPRRPVINYPEVSNLLDRFGGRDVAYDEGVVTSTHTPRSGESSFHIHGDAFQHRFVMETPIDGYSHPKIYLSLLRQVCSNGAIGYSPAFRSEISVGKDVGYCIARALESYDNDDGYSALRQRFESAQRSWASIHECLQLHKVLGRLQAGKSFQKQSTILDFYRMTGGLHELYGLANLDALSSKRQRVLPAKCRVYDLINFASELATHHAEPKGTRALQAYIGSLISDEYDMEGTAEKVTEFNDFFVTAEEGHAPISLN